MPRASSPSRCSIRRSRGGTTFCCHTACCGPVSPGNRARPADVTSSSFMGSSGTARPRARKFATSIRPTAKCTRCPSRSSSRNMNSASPSPRCAIRYRAVLADHALPVGRFLQRTWQRGTARRSPHNVGTKQGRRELRFIRLLAGSDTVGAQHRRDGRHRAAATPRSPPREPVC